MSATEIVISVGSAALGAAAGSLAVYFSSRRTGDSGSQKKEDSSKKEEAESQDENEKRAPAISIPKNELEKRKRELRTLLLEKELVSAALTRLYEAEAAGEITKEEREILGVKYKAELKSLEDKISKIDAFIQIGDLETLRNQLLQLVNQKMEAIEKRIESTKQVAEPLIEQMLNKKTSEAKIPAKPDDEKRRVPDISDLLQKEAESSIPSITSHAAQEQQTAILSIRNTGSSQVMPDQSFSLGKRTGDGKVEELQKELLDALDRLEKLDVEG
ncbi:MAG: hypothetical protein ACREBS_08035 [Nitrososphaerales archaeon]